MKVIKVNNVNDAFNRGVDLFQIDINYRRQESRNGVTLEANEPVTTVYARPWERVLFDKTRDANPFFHLIEAIWMIAGSHELDPIIKFNAGMVQFSDDGETLNGAYGYRWMNQFDFDQIPYIINILKQDPDSRRAVLQMWDAVNDLENPSKDVPCNTNIYFKIRDNKLQMTVCNRSNDMIWGAYGANAVHMSVSQEYIAAALGVEMGTYYQVSDSFHIYENSQWEKLKNNARLGILTKFMWYPSTLPLVSHSESFVYECQHFIERLCKLNWNLDTNTFDSVSYRNSFFNKVLEPMVNAFICHKERNYVKAQQFISEIKADDWEAACTNWIHARRTNYENKNG